jgi:hypothetical protein
MRRLIVSFALASLSLLSAYLIVARWPDELAPTGAHLATAGKAPAGPVTAGAAALAAHLTTAAPPRAASGR